MECLEVDRAIATSLRFDIIQSKSRNSTKSSVRNSRHCAAHQPTAHGDASIQVPVNRSKAPSKILVWYNPGAKPGCLSTWEDHSVFTETDAHGILLTLSELDEFLLDGREAITDMLAELDRFDRVDQLIDRTLCEVAEQEQLERKKHQKRLHQSIQKKSRRLERECFTLAESTKTIELLPYDFHPEDFETNYRCRTFKLKKQHGRKEVSAVEHGRAAPATDVPQRKFCIPAAKLRKGEATYSSRREQWMSRHTTERRRRHLMIAERRAEESNARMMVVHKKALQRFTERLNTQKKQRKDKQDTLQKACQLQAMENVRNSSLPLHAAALPRLRSRAQDLGFRGQDVDTTLEYIRTEAPIIIHVDLVRFGARLSEDTHYRNQFETKESNGALSEYQRTTWENDLFGNAYAVAAPFDRCKYGVLNFTRDPLGVNPAQQYGHDYFILRGVRSRATFCFRDSATQQIDCLGTADCYAHILEKYADDELCAALKVGTGTRFQERSIERSAMYKEAQIHGEIRLAEDIEQVVGHPSHRESSELLAKVAKSCCAPLVWADAIAK